MPSRDELDEAAELAEELGISRSEARRMIALDQAGRARHQQREHRTPERAIPYDGDKETR